MRLGKWTVGALVVAAAIPGSALARGHWTLSGQRSGRAHVAQVAREASPVPPGVLPQSRYVEPGFRLSLRVAVRRDAPTACAGLGDNCVTADRVMHLLPRADPFLVAHELGHVLDFALGSADPAATARFRYRWTALNGRLGAPWTDGESPPMEQFAESFASCSTGYPLRYAVHGYFRYDWHTGPATYDATCRLMRREVARLRSTRAAGQSPAA